MIISLEKITKQYSGETVLNNVALSVGDGDRIGIVGWNGCGKSTLLRIMIGQETPENITAPNEPVISRAKGKTAGYLAQTALLENGGSVYETARAVFKPLDDARKRLREIEKDMNERSEREYTRLLSFFEANEGYLTDVKINRVLNGMGFAKDMYGRSVTTLSGGERTRLEIARLLLTNPDLLILDEPTNHLDFNTVMWLEDYLRDYKGALVIVSHDRYFLDKLCSSICEIEHGGLRRYPGNYSAFMIQKAAFAQAAQKEYEAGKKEVARLTDYVARNIARASTSGMAKSRAKRLEAMAPPVKPAASEKRAGIKFSFDTKSYAEVLTARDITVTAGDGAEARTLISSFSFDVRRGDKIGIVGENGTGKSMLLKTLLGISPLKEGSAAWGKNVKIAYFDQKNASLNMDDTVINVVRAEHGHLTDGEIRNLLARVCLTGDDVFKKIGAISGGERAKLCFALLALKRANVLVLDEPTNHLDISTREVIEEALCSYEGTILFVSHDRYLLNKLSAGVIEITADGARFYACGFDEFQAKKREGSAPKTDRECHVEQSREQERDRKAKRAKSAEKRRAGKELENAIESLEAEINKLENELSDPVVFSDYALAAEKAAELDAKKRHLDETTEKWLELAEGN